METWVRFEKKYRRYHLVLTKAMGGYFTYCGRFHRAGADVNQTASPIATCRCCASRRQRPYLVPEKLLQLKEQYAVAQSNN